MENDLATFGIGTEHRAVLFTQDTGVKLFDAGQGGVALSKKILAGYAMRWNSLSNWWRTPVVNGKPGTLIKFRLLPNSAKFETPTLALFHHDYQGILGNTANGTLKIMPDDLGVRVEITPPNTTCGRDVVVLVEDKYVAGMSFAIPLDSNFKGRMKTEDGVQIMEVSSFVCPEVTVTADPSFLDTSIRVVESPAPATQTQELLASAQPVLAKDRIEQSLRLERLKLGIITL